MPCAYLTAAVAPLSNDSWVWVNSRKRFCHSEGWETRVACTAVTLYSGQLGRPVRIIGRDHVGAGLGEVERRVDHTRLHALAHLGAQDRVAGAACDTDPIPFLDAAFLASCGWISTRSSSCQRLFSYDGSGRLRCIG